MNQVSIGVALSGGGIKAFCQLPFLRFLERHKIKVSAYSGTSMGAIIASLGAAKLSANEIEKVMIELETYFVENKVFYRPTTKVLPFVKDRSNGLIDGQPLEDLLAETFARYDLISINDLPIACAITAVDLASGKLVVFTNRPDQFRKKEWIVISDVSIAAALRASCSVPLVFPTKNIDALACVDGGVLMNLPTQLLAHLKVDKVIAISMQDESQHKINDSIVGTLMRSFEIFTQASVFVSAQDADLHFNVPLSQFTFLDARMGKEIIGISEQLIAQKESELVKTVESWKKTNVVRRIIDGI